MKTDDTLALLAPLVAIADAYDANELDAEARKQWGPSLEHVNTTPPEQILIYTGRGGKTLLTLKHCLDARASLAERREGFRRMVGKARGEGPLLVSSTIGYARGLLEEACAFSDDAEFSGEELWERVRDARDLLVRLDEQFRLPEGAS